MAYFNFAHLYVDTEIALRSEWTSNVARHLLYDARSERPSWLPVRVWYYIRGFLLTTPTLSMDDWDHRETHQLRKLLPLMNMIQWSALPHGTSFPELSATPGSRMRLAQNPLNFEEDIPVHDGCDGIASEAVHWDIVLPE